MRQIFQKYFSFTTENFQYKGYAITVIWDPKTPPGKFNDSFKPNESTMGYYLNDVHQDPLWQEFEDLLPYMGTNATITCMPPLTVMNPHIDRPNRAHAIYFPISGCTHECFSDCYHLPKHKDINVRNWAWTGSAIPAYSYNVVDNAYLMNTQEWHGVRNFSHQTRIAIGWNFLGGEQKRSYSDIYKILTNLGYIKN
jgi:hypothetical protein